MEPNYVKQTVPLLLWILVMLAVLSWIPEFSVGRTRFKHVNILADIKPTPVVIKPAPKKDTVAVAEIIAPPDTCQLNIPCIEDYSANHRALGAFFSALKNAQRQPVRIAFFGDSFIEGDILTASLRDTLQQVFGGRGVGYVPLASEVAQYRTSIQHQYSNWKTYSVVGKYDEEPVFGTAGFCFVPQPDNWVEFKPGKGTRSFSRMDLFYQTAVTQPILLTVNDTLQEESTLAPAATLAKSSFDLSKAQAVKIQLPVADSSRLYGVSFEGSTGVYLDNFAMRGNSGMGLLRVSNGMHRAFNQYRDYKLIILQYGLNVVSETDSTSYDGYAKRMIAVIKRLQESFPDCSILLVSISDRSSNQEGTFKTIPAIPTMRDAQRGMARQTGIAFWDLYEAMGGENSMVKFATATPTLAAKDYTHLTFRGGRILAMKLARAILHDRKRYDQKVKTH